MEVDDTYVRTREEISEAIQLANIKESELKRVSQVVLPSEEIFKANYKLIELDENLLKALDDNSCLSFRGQKNQRAALCTENRTYEIKEAETSNTLLLIPHVQLGNDIEGTCGDSEDRIVKEIKVAGQFNTYYEVIECKPKLGELLNLLSPSSFKGPEYEKDIDPESLYDWQRLQNHIQASEGELREALTSNFVAYIDGYYRQISFEYEARAFTFMLDLMDANSWELDEIDKEETYESLKQLIPRPVFDIIFNKYTEPSEKKNQNGQMLYCYNEEKTCKFLAQILLAASPINDYKDFMESWKIGVPEKMKPKEKYLRGIALIKWNPKKLKNEVVSFPELNLSENLHKRLDELFKVKEKWTREEITPYLARCTTLTMDVSALLTKYTRTSTTNGVKYYSSKHGK